MVSLLLKKSVIPKLHMEINIENGATIEIETTFNFRVSFIDDKSQCRAILTYESRCKDRPEAFYLAVDVEGVFDCIGVSSAEDKQQAHVLAYGMLFPIAQAKLSEMVVGAGLPPLNIEMTMLEPEKVKLIEAQ